jgi:spore coat protein U-like protein
MTLATPLAASAGTSPQTTTFGASATVISSCVFGSNPIANLTFGSYDPLSTTAVTNQTTSFTYTCDAGSSSISLTATGTNDSKAPSYAMKNSSDNSILYYNLFNNA